MQFPLEARPTPTQSSGFAAACVALGILAPVATAAIPPVQDVVLTPQQRATLAQLGWPPPPPVIRQRDDLIFRRGDQPPVSGSLTALHAFATVATQGRTVRVARDQIGFILVNRRLIPSNTPVLPLDTDAVVLANGHDVLSGRVEVEGEAIHVAGRTVQQAGVALIHLSTPKTAQPGQLGSPGSSPPSGGGVGRKAGPGANVGPGLGPGPPSLPAARPRGPDEIPWGKAVWRGVVRFERIQRSVETGSYYLTWSEDSVGLGPNRVPASIFLHPVSLVYQYSWSVPAFRSYCEAFTLNKRGSGIDGVHPDIKSGGYLHLPITLGGRVLNPADAGNFYLNVFPPASIPAEDIPKTCQDLGNGPGRSVRGPQPLPNFALGKGGESHTCTSRDPSFRASPPYSTIAGEVTCGTPGQDGYKSVRWQFDRGVPPSDPTMSQDPCETPRGLLSLTRDQRRQALDRLKQIGKEFAKTRQDEERLRRTRNQLQGAFDLLLVASAGSDLGKQLLELVTGDEMLDAAAETGEITAAQREFMKQLNEFTESYQAWTEFGDDPGEWGKSRLLTESQEDPSSEEKQEHLIDGALEMFNQGQVLADALGHGDGSAALHYIEENLGAFGPLVPEYALSKARQYVEVTRQWSDAMKSLARLAGEGASLANQIAEADLGIKVRERQLQDC